MTTDASSFISILQKSKLSTKCPFCYNEFLLSNSLLFDGTKKFPSNAEVTRNEWEEDLHQRILDLKLRIERATKGSEKTTIAVGIGKIIEKILPAHKNFDMISADCRFLAEPIDMIVFNGLSENKINHITFMDIKTGKAHLNEHQKQIRDAVKDNDVKWKLL